MKVPLFRAFALAAISLLATLQVQAQVTFNPQIGVVMTHYSDEPPEWEASQKSGIQIGTFARLTLTDNLFLQPGLFIQQTKADFSGEILGVQARDEEVKTTAIKVPVYLGFYLGKVGPLRLRAAGGFAGKYVTGVEDNVFDLDGDEYRNLNWSLNLGAGFDLLLFTFDLEYDLGLSPAFETISDSRTRLFVISGGIKF
ncbi:MAG: porin family protein [Cyclobacteriaceae bacterium]